MRSVNLDAFMVAELPERAGVKTAGSDTVRVTTWREPSSTPPMVLPYSKWRTVIRTVRKALGRDMTDFGTWDSREAAGIADSLELFLKPGQFYDVPAKDVESICRELIGLVRLGRGIQATPISP